MDIFLISRIVLTLVIFLVLLPIGFAIQWQMRSEFKDYYQRKYGKRPTFSFTHPIEMYKVIWVGKEDFAKRYRRKFSIFLLVFVTIFGVVFLLNIFRLGI
ncbi:MAG: hypothetical protein Q7T49_00495 [bacterium]|nr:hypothetical protein [bacterium]